MTEFATIPAIVAAVAFICQLVKKSSIDNKWLPVIACVTGAAIGLAIHQFAPSYMPYTTPTGTTDLTHAVIIGAASGLAATGAHQVIKQVIPSAEKPAGTDEDTDEKKDGDA